MTDEIFEQSLGQELEESVRIDREFGQNVCSEEHPIATYHVTEQADDFLKDFFRHVIGEAEEMRKGNNHWLYGYYGSGKSHLLSVLGFLANSEFVQDVGRSSAWESLASGDESSLEDSRKQWEDALDKYHLIPLSINLLKHQGEEEMSLSKIILKERFRQESFSEDLEVAYFEKWYRDNGNWDERDRKVVEILESRGVDNPEQYSWKDVRQYKMIANIVMPELFQDETGGREGIKDLRPSQIDSSTVVTELEKWRSEKEKKSGKPVKLVILLDEVSLFIGTEFDRLTELNSLAEKIDEIGSGNIQLVATAQESIEEVQSEYASGK